MEMLSMRSTSTQAKVTGTLVSISGALVVVPNSFIHFIRKGLGKRWSVTYSWTHIMKTYPAELVLALLYNLFGTIVSAPFCLLIAETDLSAWRLRPGVALAAIIYSGISDSALSTVVETWCLNLKGPVYVAIFEPFSIVIAAASSVIFLGDDLFLGSIIGAVMISIGFYGVIWGKAKEEQKRDQDYGFDSLTESHSGEAPLLETYKA